MPRVTTYFSFLKEFGSLGRDEFLRQVDCPYLYLPELPDLSDSHLFTTTEFKLSDLKVAKNHEGQGIVPVRKAPDSNAFAMMITLGRAPNNDVVIPDGRISKFHAYFRRVGERWMLTDASSTNGTTIDGIRIAPDRSIEVRSTATIEMGGSVRALFLKPADLFAQMQADRVLQ
ncbi:MAG: FHA domain-containing protein [Planctomycetes bacterium]|nr:FHA domain-containing protein [Planctomycetota bacterium]